MKAFIDALNEKIDDTDRSSGVNNVNNVDKLKIHSDMQLTTRDLAAIFEALLSLRGL